MLGRTRAPTATDTTHPHVRYAIAIAALVLVGCGAVALPRAAGDTRYATTPASAGAVNPRAVPLGDGYVSTSPRVGYVYSCRTSFGGMGGAQAVGPWIDTSAKTWDSTAKRAVSGGVSWPAARYTVRTSGSRRVITFNDLPTNHTTGVFPVAASDPAAAYDRNPNHIAAQSFTWRIARSPAAASKPSCTGGGPIGVLRDGVALYDALDGEGRDAAAHEVLDRCGGHPDQSSTYHHHDIPTCLIANAPRGRSTLIGYALDGYGIYVEKRSSGALPGNAALDACHGKTSRVRWNGKLRRIYHYVATRGYPYAVGCFHGTPASTGRSTGGPPAGPGRPPPLRG